jgi:methionyl-tRNA synthetase
MRPETKDTNFSWKTFIEKVNADLNDTLGNFIHRTLTFINQHFNSAVPKPSKLDEHDNTTLESATKRLEKITQNLEEFRLQEALRHVIGLSHLGNRFLNEKEPWKTIKTNPKSAANTLYVAAQIVKNLAITLEPFTPFTAEKLWKLLNLPGAVHERTWNETKKDLPSGHKINKAKPLFSKIRSTEEELQIILEKARSNLQKMPESNVRVGKMK